MKHMIIVETPDSVDEVTKSLADHSKAQGIKVIQTPVNDEGVGQIVVSTGGYGTAITYAAADEADATNITYDVSPQQAHR